MLQSRCRVRGDRATEQQQRNCRTVVKSKCHQLSEWEDYGARILASASWAPGIAVQNVRHNLGDG